MAFLKSDIMETNFEGDVLTQFKRVNNDLNLFDRPETYLSLLKEEYGNNSRTVSTKRKLNGLVKSRLIFDESLPFINGRVKLFFIFEKSYFVVISKKNVYYCDKVKRKDGMLYLSDTFILDNFNWKSINSIYLNVDEVLKCF